MKAKIAWGYDNMNDSDKASFMEKIQGVILYQRKEDAKAKKDIGYETMTLAE